MYVTIEGVAETRIRETYRINVESIEEAKRLIKEARERGAGRYRSFEEVGLGFYLDDMDFIYTNEPLQCDNYDTVKIFDIDNDAEFTIEEIEEEGS